jgi:lactobin A/cerein 7B family class IIb bacteriocin
MAAIAIKDIRPVGTELFIDSESFLNDLTADELTSVHGGIAQIIAGIGAIAVASNAFCASLALSAGAVALGIYLAN